MKKIGMWLTLILAVLWVAWLGMGPGGRALAAPAAVTSTPAAFTPTPLPTEFLTATPTPTFTPTFLPSPTVTPTPGQNPKDPVPVLLPKLGGFFGPGDSRLTNLDARLEIPALGVYAPMVSVPAVGGEWQIEGLGHKTGWLDRTAWPGSDGNSVVVGHLALQDGDGPFAHLYYLTANDLIVLHTPWGAVRYRVSGVKIADANAVGVLAPSSRARLTLLTCDIASWDVREQGFRKRLVVIALREGDSAPTRLTAE